MGSGAGASPSLSRTKGHTMRAPDGIFGPIFAARTARLFGRLVKPGKAALKHRCPGVGKQIFWGGGSGAHTPIRRQPMIILRRRGMMRPQMLEPDARSGVGCNAAATREFGGQT